MAYFLPLFLILFAGVFSSILLKKAHIPWVVTLIVGGIIIGPEGLNILVENPVTDFVAQTGLVFLMFMAGLKSHIPHSTKKRTELAWLAFVNGIIPFIIGIGIGQFFGYSPITSLLIGIIFISSSVAVVIPSLESFKLLQTNIGQSVVITTVIQDTVSLVALSLLLQTASPLATLPLGGFYVVLGVTLLGMRWLLPKLEWIFENPAKKERRLFQQDVRGLFLVLIGTVIVFELLGLHPIVAGFFAGLVLSGSLHDKVLKDKLYTIGYGVFIPAFFIIVGTQIDLGIFFGINKGTPLLILTTIVLGSILAKYISGYMGGRMINMKKEEAHFFAVTSLPQLSSTLAVTVTGLSLGILDQTLATSLVALSVITSTIGPMLVGKAGTHLTQTNES